MNAQKLRVSCIYRETGPLVQEILLSSFSSFLGRELQKFALGPEHHVSCP